MRGTIQQNDYAKHRKAGCSMAESARRAGYSETSSPGFIEKSCKKHGLLDDMEAQGNLEDWRLRARKALIEALNDDSEFDAIIASWVDGVKTGNASFMKELNKLLDMEVEGEDDSAQRIVVEYRRESDTITGRAATAGEDVGASLWNKVRGNNQDAREQDD